MSIYFSEMDAEIKKYELILKRAAGTSRGILKTKTSYFLKLKNKGETAYAEFPLFHGLSYDDRPEYETKLKEVVQDIESFLLNPHQLTEWPSILFGIEMASEWLKSGPAFGTESFGGNKHSIRINSLIWMGSEDFMKEQIEEKLKQGFSCLKMKIGAIDFETELSLLKSIRESFSFQELELRVDANGAFSAEEAMDKLSRLAELDIHSIEQPIKQGQLDAMANLCSASPLAIALDEDLIGVNLLADKRSLIEHIRPQYLILKPALLGGFSASEEWISIAEQQGIDWWATSALESNLGLNAIAQWLSKFDLKLPQGLGTGQLFENNITSPLVLDSDQLSYDPSIKWDLKCLGF